MCSLYFVSTDGVMIIIHVHNVYSLYFVSTDGVMIIIHVHNVDLHIQAITRRHISPSIHYSRSQATRQDLIPGK